MKIKFDKDTMPDELYNALLQHFVNEAVGLGIEVNKFTEFDNWILFISMSFQDFRSPALNLNESESVGCPSG